MNKVFKLLLVLVAITSISAMLFYYYLKSTYTNVISENNFSKLVKEIKTSKPLPNDFYDLYEVQYPESLHNSFNSVIIKYIFTDKNINSPIQDVSKAYFSRTKFREHLSIFKQNDVSLSLNLDDEVTSKECLNWMVENGYTNTDKTIKNFFEEFYGKNMNDFNITELAGIVVMMKNPALYNPIRRKQEFDMKVNMIKSIYLKNKKNK